MKLLSNKNGMIMIGFPNRRELTMTMGRAQEFYESGNPRLRNKIFTQEQFLDAFTDEDGDVSYFKSWSGFNVPGDKLDEFAYHFSDLTDREHRLMDMVRRATNDRDNLPYYVIAARQDDVLTMQHEIAHAMFYLDDAYRKAATRLVRQMDKKLRGEMEAVFKEWGYARSVWVDELNAYLSTSPISYMRKRVGLNVASAHMKPFRQLFKAYSQEWD